MPKDLVLFDVGGVLLQLDYGAFYRQAALHSQDKDAEEFRDAFTSSGLEEAMLRGDVDVRTSLDRLHTLINPSQHLDDGALRRILAYCWPNSIPDSLDLRDKLIGAGYVVGVFSNIGELHHNVLQVTHPEVFLTSAGGPALYSYQHKSVKPNPAMYATVTGFDSVTFVDDKPGYLATGVEQFGWNGILYTPHVDEAEAIRAVHKQEALPKGVVEAKNKTGLRDALSHFDIRV